MTSSHIQALLARRHAKDLMIFECKDGPTQSASHRRLDAWALVKTWSPPTVIGYEIKVSRNDWLHDSKVEDYRKMCNLLVVVAPKDVVHPSELPAGIGLLTAGENSLRMTVKPVRWAGPIDEQTYQYVLMCRVRAERPNESELTREQRAERWVEWLEQKKAYHALGELVRGRYQQLWRELRDQVEVSKQKMDAYTHIEQRIKELGFDPTKRVDQWGIERALKLRVNDNAVGEKLRQAQALLNAVLILTDQV